MSIRAYQGGSSLYPGYSPYGKPAAVAAVQPEAERQGQAQRERTQAVAPTVTGGAIALSSGLLGQLLTQQQAEQPQRSGERPAIETAEDLQAALQSLTSHDRQVFKAATGLALHEGGYMVDGAGQAWEVPEQPQPSALLAEIFAARQDGRLNKLTDDITPEFLRGVFDQREAEGEPLPRVMLERAERHLNDPTLRSPLAHLSEEDRKLFTAITGLHLHPSGVVVDSRGEEVRMPPAATTLMMQLAGERLFHRLQGPATAADIETLHQRAVAAGEPTDRSLTDRAIAAIAETDRLRISEVV